MSREEFFTVMPYVVLLLLSGAAIANSYIVAVDQNYRVYRHRHTHWSLLVILTALGTFLIGYGWWCQYPKALIVAGLSLILSLFIPVLEKERDIRKRLHDLEHHEDHQF